MSQERISAKFFSCTAEVKGHKWYASTDFT
ncbi:hypothetical protein EDC47_12150 [Raoultella planticola]|nr:hypothetical protein HMPREF9687_05422 [Klebsiella oxytoca 10-5243]TCL44850.1 hypothetical protein EDC47_12150 [Raoultella planticola]